MQYKSISMKRKKAFRDFTTTPSAENKVNYVKVRRSLKKTIREAKRSSEIKLANECGGDLKRFFGFYKFNKHNARIGPIEQNGQVYHDDAVKAQAFNDQFSRVFTNECLLNITTITKVDSLQEGLTNINVSHDDIYKQLHSLKANKACGPDDISARVLKEAAEQLSPPLYTIFNASLKSGEVPDDWKRAHVVPIFKGGSKTDVCN